MKIIVVAAVAGLLVGLVQAVEPTAQERGKAQAALEQTIIGSWKGQSPCAGNFLFRADGTYDLTEYGPGLSDSAGTWVIRSNAFPATLVLTCKKSGVPDEVGKTTELKLRRLDDGSLAVEHAPQSVGLYARVKK